MNEINQAQDDGIDLFEFIQTLWNGKWLIIAFSAIAILLGGGFLLLKDDVYETKLFLSIDTSVPFKNNDIKLETFVDFQNKFYSEKIFEDWKESNSNTSLLFEDISLTEFLDGFVISKDKAYRLVDFQLDSKKVNNSFIIIRTNQMPLVLDVFKYSNQINAMLTKDYVRKAKTNLKNIDLLFKNGGTIDGHAINTVISIKTFIKSVEQGKNVLIIKRPTIPTKVSPKSSLILAMCVVLGGMVGVFFVLVSNALTKREEQLAKAKETSKSPFQ